MEFGQSPKSLAINAIRKLYLQVLHLVPGICRLMTVEESFSFRALSGCDGIMTGFGSDDAIAT